MVSLQQWTKCKKEVLWGRPDLAGHVGQLRQFCQPARPLRLLLVRPDVPGLQPEAAVSFGGRQRSKVCDADTERKAKVGIRVQSACTSRSYSRALLAGIGGATDSKGRCRPVCRPWCLSSCALCLLCPCACAFCGLAGSQKETRRDEIRASSVDLTTIRGDRGQHVERQSIIAAWIAHGKPAWFKMKDTSGNSLTSPAAWRSCGAWTCSGGLNAVSLLVCRLFFSSVLVYPREQWDPTLPTFNTPGGSVRCY